MFLIKTAILNNLGAVLSRLGMGLGGLGAVLLRFWGGLGLPFPSQRPRNKLAEVWLHSLFATLQPT